MLTGFALDRPLVGEHFHAVDELHDAVGLVADQPRQGAIVVGGRLFEQLRRAADAGERILDLVREHGRQRDDRAGGPAMGELAVHLVGDRALLQHDDHVIRPLRQRRHIEVDQALAGIARRAEIDLVLVDRRAAPAHLLDECEQRASERHQVAQQVTAQQRQRRLEEGFRGRIGIGDASVGRDHDDRMRQRVEHGIRRAGGKRGHRLVPAHAAFLSPPDDVRCGFAAKRRPLGGGEGAEVGVGVGQVTADRGRILGGQHARAMCLEQRLGCVRRFGRRIEGPAEVLARMAPTDWRGRGGRASPRRACR